MMTIENMKRANQLTDERERIAGAKWNAVIYDSRNEKAQWGALASLGGSEAADEQLQWAIEEFRARKLTAIDAQLLELGVEPPQMAAADA